jgi:hypothetical protein
LEYASANLSFGAKGKKGFPEDSINFVKLGDRLSDAIITPSEWLIVAFIMLS